MIEHNILKLFIENEDIYEKYNTTLKLDFIKTDYPLLFRLFKSLPAKSVEELEAKYLTLYPVLKDGDRKVVSELLTIIANKEVYSQSIVDYLQQHYTQSVASELANVALDVAEGRKTADSLTPIIDKLSLSVVDEVSDVEWVTTDIEELMQEEEQGAGLRWRLNVLNQSLGTLRKGNFGHIFARVETGKTAMWISEVTYMAEQVDKPILIFFNEEGGKDIIWRMYSAVTGLTYMELSNNVKRAKQIWEEKIGDKIKFIDQPALVEKKSMERIIEEVQPALIVIDNMDKVKGFVGDRKDLVLHEIYKWGRELAKTYCPIITVGQADASGHNSRYVDESQMADSKTSKPSELDFIIGIGRIEKEGYENARYISTPKNKLRGDKDTVEAMRHLKGAEVQLVPHLSIYKDRA
jgi:replicative DNA helicase